MKYNVVYTSSVSDKRRHLPNLPGPKVLWPPSAGCSSSCLALIISSLLAAWSLALLGHGSSHHVQIVMELLAAQPPQPSLSRSSAHLSLQNLTVKLYDHEYHIYIYIYICHYYSLLLLPPFLLFVIVISSYYHSMIISSNNVLLT